MLPRRTFKRNSIQRKNDFLLNFDFIVLAMRLCKRCVFARVPCQIDENFEKCVECISSDQTCSLFISSITIKRIQKERKRIRDEVRRVQRTRNEINVTLSRFERQLKTLKNQKKELITTK